MKKFGAFLTAILFVATTSVANAQLISPEDEPIPLYQDTYFYGQLFELDDYQPALDWMFENDVMTGYGDTGEIGETECVRRAEILKMLFEVRGVNTTSSTAELFSDTPEDQWYIPYVRTSRDRGTIQGYEDGTFKPGQCVNRAEAIKIALLEFNNGSLPTYAPPSVDLADVTSDQWFYDYVNYAVSNDVVGFNHASYAAYPSVNYYPGDPMTRQEVAEMLYRLKTLKDNGLMAYDEAYGPDDTVVVPLGDYAVELEEFFPQDASFVLSIDTSNSVQVRYLNNLLTYFPSNDLEGLTEEFFKELDAGLADTGLTYAADLEPIFGEGYEMMLSTSSSMYDGFEGQFAITVNNTDELKTVMDALSKADGYTYANILGFNTLTNEQEGLYLTYIDNALFLSDSVKSRYLALARIKNGEPTLMDNEDYLAYETSLPSPRIGMIYMDFNAFYGFASYGTLDNPLLMAPVQSAGYAIVTADDGIEMHEQVIGYDVPTKQPYMYKNIPGEDVIMYAEAYGLMDIYDQMGYSPVEILEEMDVEVGSTEWMNSGYAMVFYNTDSLIPGMSFYFDAGTDLASANEVLSQLDEAMNALMDEIAADESAAEFAQIFVKDTTWVDGRKFNRFAIDVTGLTEEERMEAGFESPFFDKPFEFYYGLTSDNYVLFSLYSGLDDMYKSAVTVENNTEIREARHNVSDYPYSLTYMSIPETVSYLDTLIAGLETEAGDMPEDEREAYELIKSYLAPIKYMVGANDTWENGAKGLLYLRIGE